MVANPKPAVQSGGINAVAMATPGIAFVWSCLDMDTMPAMPPKRATNTSSNVGNVLACSSLVICPNGVNIK